MVNPNWGILQPVDVGARIQEGFQQGREIQAQNALSQYAANPDAPDSMNALAKFHPMYAIKLREQQAAKQAEQTRTTAIGDALTGKADASTLAYIDPQMFQSMGVEQKKAAAQSLKTVGQMALLADTPQEWDETVTQLGPEFSEYIGKFNQRQAIIAKVGEAAKLLEQEQPQYMTPASDEDLVNVKDPAALQAFQQSRLRQAQTVAPPPGFVLDEGGSVGNGTGGFQP